MSGTIIEAWATETDLLDSCDTAAVTPAVLEAGLHFASVVLYNLTGRQWPGEATDTVRPTHGTRAHCIDASGVYLPGFPVTGITTVTIDGDVVDPARYEVLDRRYLHAVRQPDGSVLSFPSTQDLTLPTTEVNTFEVVYTWGRAPDTEWVRAAAIYGWEFALAWTPDCADRCRLPKRVTSITRQGVTATIVDPMQVIEKGGTGLVEVDSLLAALRFGQGHRRAAIGVPGRRRRASRST